MKDWMKNKEDFEIKDVRDLRGNFLPAILNKAKKLELSQGLCVIQSFEPIPLYSAMKEIGFEHFTEKVSVSEFRVYFYRVAMPDNFSENKDLPFKPTAIVNFNTIDSELANNVVKFWEYIWAKENPAIDMKTRLLLSLSNAVGAGRMRQAVREFVKAYSVGVSLAEFDELFAMFVWNQGIGYFSSEIGPSALFGAYSLIKNLEGQDLDRDVIVKTLLEKFGEKNPNVNTFFKK